MSKRQNSNFFNKFIIIVVIVIALLLVFGIIREYIRKVELDTEIMQLEDELIELKLDKKDFLQSIEAYQGDFYVEQEAREKFNLIKNGEKVAVVPIDQLDQTESNINSIISNSERRQSNVADWWGYFFGEKIGL